MSEYEQALFDQSVNYHSSLIEHGEDSTVTDEAHSALLGMYNVYLSAGGTRGEAEIVIAEGRLQAAMNRRKAGV